MKVLNVNLDYKLPKEAKNTPQELTADYIAMAVANKYKEGLDGQYKRTYARICRKLDEVIENKGETIELEEAEYDLLKNAIPECKVPVHIVKYFVVLEEEINNLNAN